MVERRIALSISFERELAKRRFEIEKRRDKHEIARKHNGGQDLRRLVQITK